MGNSQGHRRWLLGSKPPEADTVFSPPLTALSAKCHPTITQMWKLRTGESNNSLTWLTSWYEAAGVPKPETGHRLPVPIFLSLEIMNNRTCSSLHRACSNYLGSRLSPTALCLCGW